MAGKRPWRALLGVEEGLPKVSKGALDTFLGFNAPALTGEDARVEAGNKGIANGSCCRHGDVCEEGIRETGVLDVFHPVAP